MSQPSPGHVLIVDDDVSIKRMFQILLKDAGYRVSTAAAGDEVLHFLKVITPDAILLDISLPGIDGVELTRMIKGDPSRPFIPIILVTALGDMKTKIAGLDAGADDFLVKPVEFSELLARLRVMIRLQQSRRSLQDTRRRIETLLRVSQTLTTTLDVETLLQRMIQQLADSLGAVRGSIILVNGGATPFYASASKQLPRPETIADSLRDGVAGWVIRARRSLLLADARRDSRWNTFGRSQDLTRSVLVTPILQEHEVLGVITLVHSSVGYFQDTHRELLESIAAQSALALRHARLFLLTNVQKLQLERRSQLLEEILNVGERLRLNLPLAAILDEIAEAVHRSLGFEGVVIQLSAEGVGEGVQGHAGRLGPLLSTTLTPAAIDGWIRPLLRTRFQVSRSFFVPAAFVRAPDTFDMLEPTSAWMPADRLFVPIGPSSHPMGMLVLDQPVDDAVPDLATLQALEIFADQVASAVQNRRLFMQEQERANQLQMLVEVGSNLTELMTSDQLLRLVTSLIQHSFGFWSVAVLLSERDQPVLRAAAQTGGSAPPVGRAFALQGPLARVFQQHTVRSDTAATLCLSYDWLDDSVRSELAVPITTRRQTVGALVVASNHEFAFDDVTETLLTALAGQLTVALENARLFTQEQAQVQQLSRVNALSVKLSAGLALEERLHVVLQDVAKLFNAAQAALLIYLPERQQTLSITFLAHDLALDRDQLAALATATPSVALLDADAATPLHAALLERLGMAQAVIAPLPQSARASGLLVLAPASRYQRWNSADRNLVQTVANLLGQALENSELYAETDSRQRTLSAVLSSAADPIVVIGSDDTLLLSNPAAYASLNLRATDVGQPVRHPLLQTMLQSPKAGLEYTLEDGRIVQPSIARIANVEGMNEGQVVVLQDISALKMLEQQRMQRLRDDMSRYMAPQLVEQLLTEGGFGAIAEKEVAVLFADLRGFTALSEGLAPRIVVEQVLNRFFTEMTQVLYAHEGMIDKFLGDGIMAVFGSIRSRSDDAPRAVEAAIAMQMAFSQLQESWRRELNRTIGLGIGISYGRAVVGNLGSPQRLDYTLIGDVVNTASRLVDLAESGQIILAQPLVEQLPAAQRTRLTPLPAVLLKGKSEHLHIYEVQYAPGIVDARPS